MRDREPPYQQGQGEAPAFDYPWQAQVFALAVSLQEAGRFSRAEWSDALGRAIAKDEASNGPDTTGARYYDCWLAALEELLQAKGLAEADSLRQRRRAWEEAYLSTPHGQPVELPHSTK
ncbi:nitrile hydratase accessory protein [Fodinicurvata fenggangensis]|uniref:nitrile hydratase accessory protein n=1 Tax=Fodinicurvata fenggangensis TaxID=1121830 RepID=UPI00068C76E5|nr:nitrile hydratase accessory protein [Fodinicurvata fenggangensis]